MARKGSSKVRYESLNQWQQRKFKKKNSPQSRKERDWTFYILNKLKGANDDDNSEASNLR
jgi:hypothetical protein